MTNVTNECDGDDDGDTEKVHQAAAARPTLKTFQACLISADDDDYYHDTDCGDDGDDGDKDESIDGESCNNLKVHQAAAARPIQRSKRFTRACSPLVIMMMMMILIVVMMMMIMILMMMMMVKLMVTMMMMMMLRQ